MKALTGLGAATTGAGAGAAALGLALGDLDATFLLAVLACGGESVRERVEARALAAPVSEDLAARARRRAAAPRPPPPREVPWGWSAMRGRGAARADDAPFGAEG